VTEHRARLPAVSGLNSRLTWGALAGAALAGCYTFSQDGLAARPINWLSPTLMIPAYALLLAATTFSLLCGYGVRFPLLGERSSQEPSFPILPDPPPDDARSDICQALDGATSPGETREALAAASGSGPKPAAPVSQSWLRLVRQLPEKAAWDTWQGRTYAFSDPNSPWVSRAFIRQLYEATEWIYGRTWPPGHPEPREAIETYGLVISDLLQTFDKHAQDDSRPGSDSSMTERFYKNFDEGLDATPAQQSRYQEALAEYRHHVELLVDLALEATAYANYISDLVRAELDPEFRADEGALLVRMAYEYFQIGTKRPEFSSPELENGQPYSNLQAFDRDRGSRTYNRKAE
jgi:hypothetical protein